jgi:membrane-bound metal-dependent hydrolase YbcI (DUF457 family)
MGRSHAISGAAGWAGLCAASAALGHQPAASTLLIGATVTAGFALVPDLDHPSSLIARTFGPVSRLAARGIAAGSKRVYYRTRTKVEKGCGSGHRTFTHTAAFALATGGAVSLACWLGGRWALLVVAFVAAGLALRGLLSTRERHRTGPVWIALASAAAAIACAYLPDASGWAWLGIPAGLGCLIHSLGDACTIAGAPVLWPLKLAGLCWYPIGLPEVMRLRTGSWVESHLLLSVLAIGGLAAGWVTLT